MSSSDSNTCVAPAHPGSDNAAAGAPPMCSQRSFFRALGKTERTSDLLVYEESAETQNAHMSEAPSVSQQLGSLLQLSPPPLAHNVDIEKAEATVTWFECLLRQSTTSLALHLAGVSLASERHPSQHGSGGASTPQARARGASASALLPSSRSLGGGTLRDGGTLGGGGTMIELLLMTAGFKGGG